MEWWKTSANARHAYSFPRIYGIMNDGKLSYDIGRDGQGQEIGSCSVPLFPFPRSPCRWFH